MAWTAPATFTVGQVLTAATLNTQLRDNDLYLEGDSAWTAVTFQSGWVNVGGLTVPAAYKRVGDFTVLRGTISSGGSGTVAFTLPVGYRPTASYYFKGVGSADAAGTYAVVAADGTVAITTSTTTFVSLGVLWIPVV